LHQINNGSISSPTRKEEKFQRIFFGVLNDISSGNHGFIFFEKISGAIKVHKKTGCEKPGTACQTIILSSSRDIYFFLPNV
jgi:hypothetical protein